MSDSLNPAIEPAVAVCPTLQIGADLSVRLLALVIEDSGDEAYLVSFRTSSIDPFVPGTMTHVQGEAWYLLEDGAMSPTRVTWTTPDEVFALALGCDVTSGSSDVRDASPHWPDTVVERLVRRRLSGPGTVAFDAGWFLTELATSALERPILLPDATAKLGLMGLERARAILAAAEDQGASHPKGLVDLLLRALEVDQHVDPATAWIGDGRLIGEFHDGELAQVGTDIDDGCRAALGTGPLEVVFAPLEPLGVGLGPLLPTDVAVSRGKHHDFDSVGVGCVVGEVTSGGAADRTGVRPGMMLSHLLNPHVDLTPRGPDPLSFEGILDKIDARRSAGCPLTIVFETAAQVSRLYAVEMPAAGVLHALAATVDEELGPQTSDVGVEASFDALCGRDLVWREDIPRLFLGEAGSVTCAHTDICPQVQMAHGLFGTKLLGVASHHATPRLCAEHALVDEADGGVLEHEATTLPTDRPLTSHESRLLCDPEVTIAVLRAGDLAVFDSGAMHFASNGAKGINGAVYHGLITPGAVPRLRQAAAADAGLRPETGDYSDHLFASELLTLVERRLASS